MKKDFIVRRSITMIDGKPHVETYSEQELVRCKDCVYGMMFKNVKDEQRFECVSPTHNGTYVEAHDPGWFCADGKRAVKLE